MNPGRVGISAVALVHAGSRGQGVTGLPVSSLGGGGGGGGAQGGQEETAEMAETNGRNSRNGRSSGEVAGLHSQTCMPTIVEFNKEVDELHSKTCP